MQEVRFYHDESTAYTLGLKEIRSCKDRATLLRWREGVLFTVDHIQSQLEIDREHSVGDQAWYRATTTALAYQKSAVRQIDRQLRSMGHVELEYAIQDRDKAIARLNETLAEHKTKNTYLKTLNSQMKLKLTSEQYRVAVLETDEEMQKLLSG